MEIYPNDLNVVKGTKSNLVFLKEMETENTNDFVEINIKTPRATDDFKIFKVIVIGDSGVGKSSFIHRYVNGTYSEFRRTTIGLDFVEHMFQWDPLTSIRLHFWDIPGQERLRTQPKLFYRDARAILVMFDASRPATLTQARSWKQETDALCTLDGRQYRPPAILLANKIDLLCDRSEDFDTSVLNMVVKEEAFRCGFPISNLGNYNIAQVVKKLVGLLLDEEKILRATGLLSDNDDGVIIDLTDIYSESSKVKNKCVC
jgi:small GTP-binding protein